MVISAHLQHLYQFAVGRDLAVDVVQLGGIGESLARLELTKVLMHGNEHILNESDVLCSFSGQNELVFR